MTIRNVTIGDKFIDTMHRKSKRISTVIDFAETRSMSTGEVLNISIISKYEFMGQTMTGSPAFSTVVINRVS